MGTKVEVTANYIVLNCFQLATRRATVEQHVVYVTVFHQAKVCYVSISVSLCVHIQKK